MAFSPVGNGFWRRWRYLFFSRASAATTSSVAYQAGEVGDIDQTTVEIDFTALVNSPALGYDAGVTIKINAVTVGIVSAVRQDPVTDLVHYVINTLVDIDDVVTWEYDDDFGDLEDAVMLPLTDISPKTVVNYVGSQYYFNTEESSMWIPASVG